MLIVAAAAVQFNPYADTDFSAFEGWLDSLYTAASQNGYSMSMFVNIPLTAGNKIYVLTSVASEFLILRVLCYIRECLSEKDDQARLR